MKNDDKQDALEHNLAEMLSRGGDQVTSGFERRLIQVVGRQVQRQRQARIQRRWFVRASVAAAILIAAVLIIPQGLVDSDAPIGLITDIRGLVIVSNGESSEFVEGQRSVHARQWVQTQSGTTAHVVLADQSRLTPHPRTAMQLDLKKHGHTVRLEKGSVAIEAHKQPPGRYLMVQTPGTSIKILGTRLDVRVVEKPTGVKQTRVRLHSGSVELASGGISTLLLPGMVGIAEEGRAPSGESSVLEVNELRRLLQDTRRRAEQTNAQANMPMIIDYVNSTVWTIVPLGQFNANSGDVYSLRLKYPAFRVKAYTLEGAAADTRAEGRVLRVDLSQRSQTAGVILRIPNAAGLFRVGAGSIHELAVPADASPSVTLLQLCLPKSAMVHAIEDEIIETSERLDRQIVTLAADSQTLHLYE